MDRFELSEVQVIERLNAQSHAIEMYEIIQEELGADYAGAWFDDEQLSLTVATTAPERLSLLHALEVNSVLVTRTLAELELAERMLKEAVSQSPELWQSITGWSVSYIDNAIKVDVLPDTEQSLVSHLQAHTSIELNALTFRSSPGRATPLSTIRAGDMHNPADPDGWACSFGFSLEGTMATGAVRYLTAGHCGWPSHQVQNNAGQILGTYTSSTYPPTPIPGQQPGPGEPYFAEANRDFALIRPDPPWNPSISLNTYGSPALGVFQLGDSPIGTYVCRFGRTTEGPHCGTITGKGTSIGGWLDLRFNLVITHHNLIEVSTCADGGDSGGPLVSFVDFGHVRAEGLTSAGTHPTGCPMASPDTRVYFSPVKYILQDHWEWPPYKLMTGYIH